MLIYVLSRSILSLGRLYADLRNVLAEFYLQLGIMYVDLSTAFGSVLYLRWLYVTLSTSVLEAV